MKHTGAIARAAPLLLFAAHLLLGGTAADLAKQIAEAGLNPDDCYRVRDLTLQKEDLRFYFTDGFIIFGNPIGGAPVSAVFVTSIQGGDAEVLTLPPSRSERQSLAGFTGSPNLNEHFHAAVMLFTDQTYRDLMTQIRDNPSNKKIAEMGVALIADWNPVISNLRASFESRLVLDMLSGRREDQAFFFAAIRGMRLGNFDVFYDLRSREQITIGQVAFRETRAFFDVWTTFQSRSIRNGSRTAPKPEFTLNDFRIDTALEPPDLRLQVVTRVKAKPSGGSLSALPFELSRRMRVTAVSVDGQPAEVFDRESMRSNLIHDRGNYLLLVVPPQPVGPGREYEVEFKHEGALIADVGNKVYAIASRANWYPSRGLQFANFDATFRYPKELDLVSAGEVFSDISEGELRITRRKTTAPIRMLGFNLGVYERTKITRGKQTIEVCANRNLERALQPRMPPPVRMEAPPAPFPGRLRREAPQINFPPDSPPLPFNPAVRLRELADDIASAIDFMSARFGPPPLPTITVSPVPGAFGQGFPGLIYLSTLSYLKSSDRPIARMTERNKLFFSELLAAHEVAHQWWGNVVASSGYEHDWLLEALANYSSLLYLEKQKGLRAIDSVLNEYRGDMLNTNDAGKTLESAGPIALGYRLETSQNPDAWRIVVYEKGSWILHMIRRQMGDARFDSFLGELRRRFELKNLDMEGFRLLAAEFLPPKSPDPKLESFFDQWVYSTGVPTLKVKHSLSGKAPALKLTVTVEQTGVDDDFSVAAPVEIQFRNMKPVTRMVRTSNEPAVFTIPVRQAPVKVVLDPGNTLLAVKN